MVGLDKEADLAELDMVVGQDKEVDLDMVVEDKVAGQDMVVGDMDKEVGLDMAVEDKVAGLDMAVVDMDKEVGLDMVVGDMDLLEREVDLTFILYIFNIFISIY